MTRREIGVVYYDSLNRLGGLSDFGNASATHLADKVFMMWRMRPLYLWYAGFGTYGNAAAELACEEYAACVEWDTGEEVSRRLGRYRMWASVRVGLGFPREWGTIGIC